VKLRCTTILHYKGSYNEDLVATRIEIAWEEDNWLDITGMTKYELWEWELLIRLLLLGARRSQAVDILVRDLTTRHKDG
jgi:hypothetical protein